MRFRISRVESIRFPNKCIWCGSKPILEYPSGYHIPEQKSIEYPVCKRHYFWSLRMDLAYLVVLFGIPGVLQPERVRGVKGRSFYTLIIRNDDYAREFPMLNGLSPT